MKKIRVAFVKFGGLSAGGTERWLQMIAANLPRDQFEVDYYYCDSAPYVGSDYQHADTDPNRKQYMLDRGINLIKFNVSAKDVTTSTHEWIDTDFWDKFDENKYNFVQTAKAGPEEYPYYSMATPVIECVTLSAGVDRSPNLIWSFHLSQWQRRGWVASGGDVRKSSIVPIPVLPPATNEDLRASLKIPASAVVCGFHQRNDDAIFSPIPLNSFAKIRNPDCHFIIMGGGPSYRNQAARLGLKNIHFIDHTSDSFKISQFLNTLDVFAHGRRDGETFGAVIAEAMVHGKACISHRSLVGNNNAQIETMGPGGIFASTLNDYTEGLDTLISDSLLRNHLSSKAKKHAEDYFSLDSCIQKVSTLYKRLAGIPDDFSSTPLEYGFSPIGYLQAGDITDSASIAHHIVAGGIPEAFEVHMTRFFLPKVNTFIDIGANIGLYCLLAARYCSPDANVYAYEPQEVCAKALRTTVWLNNWEQRLQVMQLALGSSQKMMTLHLSGTGSSLDNSFNDNRDVPIARVPVDTLDIQVNKTPIEKVDFIKIDVEGYELHVLEGAKNTIISHRPILLIEIADRVRGRKYRNPHYKKTLVWLRAHGYSTWRCTEDGRLVKQSLDKHHDHLAMYLCLHDSLPKWDLFRIRLWALLFKLFKFFNALQRRYKYVFPNFSRWQ